MLSFNHFVLYETLNMYYTLYNISYIVLYIQWNITSEQDQSLNFGIILQLFFFFGTSKVNKILNYKIFMS